MERFAYLMGQQVLCAGYSEEEAGLAQQSFAGLARADTYQEYQENWSALSSIEIPGVISFTGKDIISEEDWVPWDRNADAFFDPIEINEYRRRVYAPEYLDLMEEWLVRLLETMN